MAREQNRIDHATMMDHYAEIFEGYYTIITRSANVYTDLQLNHTGIPFTGDDQWDENAAKSFTHVSMSIAEMAELHANGMKFYFKYTSSVPDVYRVIVQYINSAMKMLDQNYVTEAKVRRKEILNEFIGDLSKLAELANHLRSAISYIKSTEEEDAVLKESTSMLSRMTWVRHGENHDDEPNTDHLPDKVDVRAIMSPRLSGNGTIGGSRPWMRLRQRQLNRERGED